MPLRTHPAEVLRALEVPSAGLSPDAAEAVGTPSVAEAAVLAEGAELVVPKHVRPGSTVAIGRVTATDGDRPAPGARR
nr:cobalamin biosynthesis protein [Mobilicoccus caccae]